MNATAAWLQRLMEAPRSERGAVLEALVVAEFRAWLLMGEGEPLAIDVSYFDLGLTSLGATEIQARLDQALGRRIESDSLFNNPTIGHLLAHLRTEVLADLFAEVPAPQAAELARTPSRDLVNHLLDELYDS